MEGEEKAKPLTLLPSVNLFRKTVKERNKVVRDDKSNQTENIKLNVIDIF